MTGSLAGALAAYAARPRILVALDVDGVLAPIVARPQDARALPESMALLAELAARPGVEVALVTGRSLAGLVPVLTPPPGVHVVASHGAEVDGLDLTLLDEPAAAALEGARRVVDAIVAAYPGTSREDKPAAVVLHTREADRELAAAAMTALRGRLDALPGIHALPGKEVLELSAVRADKGTALLALRDRLGVDSVLYAGDDVTDEHAFAVLGEGDVTVKVGEGDTAARHRIADPVAVTDLLAGLAAARPA